jgi:hypothetical protein
MATSKQQAFEAEERQNFLAGQPQAPVFYPQAQPYGIQQPGYVVQTQVPVPQQYVLQQYPVQSVPVVNVVRQIPNGHHHRSDCCTSCWGITLFIFAIMGIGGSIYTVSTINTAWRMFIVPPPSDPNYNLAIKVQQLFSFFSTVSSVATTGNILTVILTSIVVYAICTRSTKPAVRTLNYIAWIGLALVHASSMIGLITVSLIVTLSATALSAFLNAVIDNQTQIPPSQKDPIHNAIDALPIVISVLLWIAAVITLIPLIITSVVASRNRVRCSCDTHDEVDNPDYRI